MITIAQVSDGAGYLIRHLSANDYYAEAEKVTGYWRGLGAERLGLESDVTAKDLSAIGSGIHPETGEKLRQRRGTTQFHDMTISAPKAFSIAAVIGGDERLIAAFHEVTDKVIQELEKLAAVRNRAGKNHQTEKTRRTGNLIAAVYQHDSSRSLDPQLHAHLVIANMSFDHERQGWYALQPKAMLEDISVREFFYQELADRAEKLGYTVEWRQDGFGIKGIDQKLEECYSERTLQKNRFIRRYESVFGNKPDKARIEAFIKEGKTQATARFMREFREAFGRAPSKTETIAFVRDWRDNRLKNLSTEEVRKRQMAKLGEAELKRLETIVGEARNYRRPRWMTPITTGLKQALQRLKSGWNDLKRMRRYKQHQHRVAVSRSELYRRLKFGRNVTASFQTYHAALASASIRKLARS